MSGVTLTSLPSVLMLTRGKGWLDQPRDTAVGGPDLRRRRPRHGSRQIYRSEHALTDGEVVAEWKARVQSPYAQGCVRPVGRSGSRDVVFAFDTGEFPKGSTILRISPRCRAAANESKRRIPFQVV